MTSLNDYIASGKLEAYVLGICSDEDAREVAEMAEAYDDIRKAIDELTDALEQYGRAHAVTPDPTIKPFVVATIDYMERIGRGEEPSFPPLLHPGSRISDYSRWTSRPDMELPVGFTDFHAKILGATPEATTVLAWMRYGSPEEVHHNEYESFLVLEGSCDVTIGNMVHQLQPGDMIAIPLHVPHNIVVTSLIPCKVILERKVA
jgi:mannose-6-phosphate isomerase-like protein (cupin superfamily)